MRLGIYSHTSCYTKRKNNDNNAVVYTKWYVCVCSVQIKMQQNMSRCLTTFHSCPLGSHHLKTAYWCAAVANNPESTPELCHYATQGLLSFTQTFGHIVELRERVAPVAIIENATTIKEVREPTTMSQNMQMLTTKPMSPSPPMSGSNPQLVTSLALVAVFVYFGITVFILSSLCNLWGYNTLMVTIFVLCLISTKL